MSSPPQETPSPEASEPVGPGSPIPPLSDPSTPAGAGSRKPSFWDAFTSPRIALMLGFGFASGLPNPLVGSTLTAWMASVDVDLTTIGFFSAVSLPYNFKFLWAWLLDRYPLPFLDRRRGWILVIQAALVVSVGVLGTVDPVLAPWLVAGLAFGITCISASQDIVIDAYRTEILAPEERASGTAVFVAAFRAAMIVAGAGALILADQVSWTVVYWCLAGLIGLGMVVTLIAPTPTDLPRAPQTLKQAVLDPFTELLKREHAFAFLTIVLLYKVGDSVAGHLLNPFLLQVGFTLTEIGAVLKGLGLGATIVGALVGGGLVAKWGLKRSLIGMGIAQASGNLTYAALAVVGKSYWLMTAGIVADNLMNGMGTAALVALLMTLCDKRFTAMQFALLSSLSTIAGRLIGLGSGWLVEQVGWPLFFVLSVAVSAPAILLLTRVDIDERREPGPVEKEAA